jgi:prephenate dehydrogenase
MSATASLPHLGIVGTGLIGTSIALAARHSGLSVVLSDTRQDHLEGAVAAGAGSVWVGEDPALIVVAVPPNDAGRVVAEKLNRHVTSTVMDVASTKFNVVVDVKTLGADTSRFVPSHPMAGREVSGPTAARPDLFADRVWVVCPGAAPAHEKRALNLIEATRAVAVRLSAEAHDRAVATTSHAAQLLSSALAARLLALAPEEVRISGKGLRDATRLAASDPHLWQQILRANSREVAVTLRAIGSDLNAAAKELERLSDTPPDLDMGMSTIEDLLARGREGHTRVPGRHGEGSERLATVAVQVSDEPGALAGLFVAAGDLGINLEDVRIDHLWGRPSGLVELSVFPDSAAALRDGLQARGFTVRA